MLSCMPRAPGTTPLLCPTSNKLPVLQHLQEQGYEKLSPGRASATPPVLGWTVLSGRSVAAPQAGFSPPEVKLSASHYCQAPTNRGLGGILPPRAQEQVPQPPLSSRVPRDLFCSLPSASPFLCLAISEVSTLSPCQDLNLLYHSLYALQRACKCPARLSFRASIPPSFPQRAEGSSHISHTDPDPFSKSVPKISHSPPVPS